MHLSAPVQHWLESLPGFIGLEAQTLTTSPSDIDCHTQPSLVYRLKESVELAQITMVEGGVGGPQPILCCVVREI